MKTYLGDGAYVEFDGWGWKITTEDGVRATNTIYFEPEVLKAFDEFVDKTLRRKRVVLAKEDQEEGV